MIGFTWLSGKVLRLFLISYNEDRDNISDKWGKSLIIIAKLKSKSKLDDSNQHQEVILTFCKGSGWIYEVYGY